MHQQYQQQQQQQQQGNLVGYNNKMNVLPNYTLSGMSSFDAESLPDYSEFDSESVTLDYYKERYIPELKQIAFCFASVLPHSTQHTHTYKHTCIQIPSPLPLLLFCIWPFAPILPAVTVTFYIAINRYDPVAMPLIHTHTLTHTKSVLAHLRNVFLFLFHISSRYM